MVPTVAAAIVGGGLFLWLFWLSDIQGIFYRVKGLIEWLFVATIFVALPLSFAEASETEFKCGDKFITFPSEKRDEKYVTLVTIRKTIIMGIQMTDPDYAQVGGKGGSGISVTAKTRVRILKCLD